MAQWYRAFVEVPAVSGLPADAITNSFAFVVGGTGDRDLTAANIDNRLTSFYNGWVQYGGSQYLWDSATVSVVDMTDAKPRFPFYEAPLSLTPGSAVPNDLPSEVAVVLSFEGAKTSGANMRRRRGRVYCGPLQILSEDYFRLNTTIQNAIANSAGTNLLNAAVKLCDWAVYSPYTHHGIAVGDVLTKDDPEIPDALPASFTPVVRCWVDNAFDTQRRRGVEATARTIITAT